MSLVVEPPYKDASKRDFLMLKTEDPPGGRQQLFQNPNFLVHQGSELSLYLPCPQQPPFYCLLEQAGLSGFLLRVVKQVSGLLEPPTPPFH